MNRHTVPTGNLPTLRPLAASLLLALATLPVGVAIAGDLNDESAVVNPGDAPEAWRLINDSQLAVVGGRTLEITADGTSTVTLENADVARSGTAEDAIRLYGDAVLDAQNSRILGSILLAGGNAEARIENSEVIITTAGQLPGDREAVGVDIGSTPAGSGARNSSAWISGTTIRVEDAPDTSLPFNSGLGVRLMFGQMDICQPIARRRRQHRRAAYRSGHRRRTHSPGHR